MLWDGCIITKNLLYVNTKLGLGRVEKAYICWQQLILSGVKLATKHEIIYKATHKKIILNILKEVKKIIISTFPPVKSVGLGWKGTRGAAAPSAKSWGWPKLLN